MFETLLKESFLICILDVITLSQEGCVTWFTTATKGTVWGWGLSIDLYWVNYIPVSITGQMCTFSVLLTIQLLALKS